MTARLAFLLGSIVACGSHEPGFIATFEGGSLDGEVIEGSASSSCVHQWSNTATMGTATSDTHLLLREGSSFDLYHQSYYTTGGPGVTELYETSLTVNGQTLSSSGKARRLRTGKRGVFEHTFDDTTVFIEFNVPVHDFEGSPPELTCP